jgi:LCP family protein required for cell wall assembly
MPTKRNRCFIQAKAQGETKQGEDEMALRFKQKKGEDKAQSAQPDNPEQIDRIKAAKKRRGIFLAIFEITALVVMAVFLMKLYSTNKGSELRIMELQAESLSIAPEVEADPVQKGYWNIALFGVDANTPEELIKGSRSDSIMIASVNLDTGDIKLVSLYRDSFMNIGNDNYTKICHAYHYGGAEQAIQALNSNLDMDIKDFITVGYQALTKTIDGLGGIYIEVDEAELDHVNNYQIGVSQVLKTDYQKVEKPGYQLLNGLQASAYCRVRQTAGSDFKRAARQREVIQAMEVQAKKEDPATLAEIFGDIMGEICTSLDQSDVLELLPHILEYRIVSEDGFPGSDMRINVNVGKIGSSEVPNTLADNVIWLHEFLFPEQEYKPSNRVLEYSKVTEEKIAIYLD